MIWLILGLVFLYLANKKILKTDYWFESLGVSLILFTALMGTVPVIAFEYLGISYSQSAFSVAVVCGFILVGSWLFGRKEIDHSGLTDKHAIAINMVLFISGLMMIKALFLPVQGWDAFSLYDARAHMMLQGKSLASFVEFSKYDNFNRNYYLSYPPMTSAIHTVLYSVGLVSPMIVYSGYYLGLGLLFVSILRIFNVNRYLQAAATLTFMLNPLIISQTSVAYTNLPLLAYQVAALFFIVYFIKFDSFIYLLLSGLFLGFGNWTRNEPTYTSFIIAVAVILFVWLRHRYNLFQKLGLLASYILLTVLWRQLWQSYILYEAGMQTISSVDHSNLSILNKLMHAMYLENLLNVGIFMYQWFKPIEPFIIMVILGLGIFLRRMKFEQVRIVENTILIILCGTLFIMIAGTMYFSQVFTWWDQIGGSLVRSSLLLIPLSLLYAAIFVTNNLQKQSKDSRVNLKK